MKRFVFFVFLAVLFLASFPGPALSEAPAAGPRSSASPSAFLLPALATPTLQPAETPAPTAAPTSAASRTPTAAPSPAATVPAEAAKPSATPVPSPTPASAPTPTVTPTVTPTATPTPTPTATPTATPAPTPLPIPKVIDRISNPGAFPEFSFFPEDDLLEVWFPCVRDQDCAIFLYQDQVWMVDCGDERARKEIVPLLKCLGIEKIDKLFNTHPHHDHLNGFSWIHREIPITELLICFPEDATEHMTAAMEYAKGNGILVTFYEDESHHLMGDGLVSFLSWQKSDPAESINDRSSQFMVSYGSCDLLIMADMEIRGQKQLYEALGPEPLAADILRYPHHGKLAMVEEVFSAVHPALTIITNSPRIAEISEATYFLDLHHAATVYTRPYPDHIHLVTDGTRWICEKVSLDLSPWTPAE